MTNEICLEYLTLKNVMDGNVPMGWERNPECDRGWYSDNTSFKFDNDKITKRLTELEKLIMKPYVIDNTL